MRKTVPQYTVFTCDCCGREQDDCTHQIKKLENAPDAGYPFQTYFVSWSKESYGLESRTSMEVCSECAQRIHDAIQEVIRKASAENVQEQLAMYERSWS